MRYGATCSFSSGMVASVTRERSSMWINVHLAGNSFFILLTYNTWRTAVIHTAAIFLSVLYNGYLFIHWRRCSRWADCRCQARGPMMIIMHPYSPISDPDAFSFSSYKPQSSMNLKIKVETASLIHRYWTH